MAIMSRRCHNTRDVCMRCIGGCEYIAAAQRLVTHIAAPNLRPPKLGNTFGTRLRETGLNRWNPPERSLLMIAADLRISDLA